MKKNIYIPHRKTIAVKKPKKAQRTTYKEEKKPLGEVCKEQGIDIPKMSKLINLAFLLSDVMEGLVLDVETELKKADPNLGIELRHPISRIKVHTKEMVRFVDNTMKNEEASYDFGEKSDEIREILENYFK